MADQRTMAQLLQASTGGYEDAIVIPAITADNFELKHGLLTLVKNKQFFGHDKEDPHAHIQYFNMITSTLKFPNVPNTSIKLMLFPFSLEGVSRIWLEKEQPRSIFTWDDLVSKFINQFFPPSKTTNLRNEITNFQQHFDESFSKALDRFKDLLRACPHHGFLELHQLDTFYNALNSKDQDSLNSAASVVAKVNTNTSTFGISHDVAELKDMVKALLLDKKSQNQAPATVKAVEESYVVEDEPETTKDTVHPTNNESTEDVQPLVVQSKSLILTFEPVNSLISEPVNSLVSAPRPNLRPSIPYPSRMQDQKLRNKGNDQHEKFFQIFKDLNFNISFADALILMPKFGPSSKSLLTNKDKLCELARTPLNEHCSAVLLKKLLEKLGDPDKFLIPCDYPRKAQCLALADLSASINLMPLSVWNKLSFPDLTPTCMTLELVDHSISHPIGVAEDVYVKVGKLTLRVGKDAMTFNLDKTSRYSANYNKMTAKQIDIIDMACEEYSQEVWGFSDVILSGNPTPYYDPIVSTTSTTLTPFGNSDFLLEEVDAFLTIEDDPTSLEVNQYYLDLEGDILLFEAFLNDDPSLPLPTQGNYLPEVRKELKIYDAKSDKSSIDEPLKFELKNLSPNLEYAFLEGDDKLLVIIAKDLSMEDKTSLISRVSTLNFALTKFLWKRTLNQQSNIKKE
nr:reverse transcriptase domain-containing protein [Tanacetum cinerariifolium]